MFPKIDKSAILNALLHSLYLLWKRSHRDFLVIFNYHQVTPEFDPQYHNVKILAGLDLFKKIIFVPEKTHDSYSIISQ